LEDRKVREASKLAERVLLSAISVQPSGITLAKKVNLQIQRGAPSE
jgi:hypothetical protein